VGVPPVRQAPARLGPPRPLTGGVRRHLAVAALFQPARRRIHHAIDRRFNRRRYTTAKIIEAFSAQLRNQTDLNALSAELLAVAHQTTEPVTASLWLRPPVNCARHVSH
jgi:hypothetical protein